MEISFSGKKFSVTGEIKEHLNEKIGKLDRLAPRLVEAHVVLIKEKKYFEAEITLLGKDLRVFSDGQSKDNLYAAIDQAYARMEKQLKKFREKVTSHHRGLKKESISPKVAIAEAVNSDTETDLIRPEIVPSRDHYADKPMSAEEASLQLELSNREFLVFLNPQTKSANVIYKREDGNHGLIEPVF